jgi:transcriptional regulator with GAF, ATPase, and Fis domain
MDADQPVSDDELSRVLAVLSLQRIDRQSLAATLDHMATLARDVIPAADYAAITILRDGKPETIVATDPVIELVDQVQYDVESGPCLDAYTTAKVFRIDETDDEKRWPEFARTASVHGIHSTLSLPLMTDGEGIGALNLYSRTVRGFSTADEVHGQRFSNPAAVVVANAYLFWECRRLAENLEAAMASRAVIEQAKGMLMGQHGVDADGAFDLLRRASQRENVKLREVARRLVETVGQDPSNPPDPPDPPDPSGPSSSPS